MATKCLWILSKKENSKTLFNYILPVFVDNLLPLLRQCNNLTFIKFLIFAMAKLN